MTAKASRLKALLARSQAAVSRLRQDAEAAKTVSRRREAALRGSIEALKEDKLGMQSAIRAACTFIDQSINRSIDSFIHSFIDSFVD